MVRLIFCSLIFIFLVVRIEGQSAVYRTYNGTLSFTSDAPLEIITASSKKMEGLIDAGLLTFAFSVPVLTFEGFNNGLQQQHFYENYMETDKYPSATFSGKLIEHVDLTKPGTYTVRAKGMLTIHGRAKERIIKAEIISNGQELRTRSSFIVSLMDHQIEVPRIVNQKIAQEITITVQATFQLSGKS